MGNQQAPGNTEEEITLVSDTDGMLWKMKFYARQGVAEIIPVIEAFHSENDACPFEAGHVIHFSA